ncbi:MAG: S49 family peptidase [Planctomycetaceae bacterium]|nr:MAG: S49 family peptidase [Planctomycetaceae bacterium]
MRKPTGQGRGTMIRKTALRTVPLAILAGSLVGCQLPQPIDVRTRVIVEPSPVKDVSPIVEMPVAGRPACGPRVAIIDVDGVLANENRTGLMSQGANPVDLFRAKLGYAAGRPEIVAVVVRIHSPGGGVTASDIMRRDLERFREATGRPVVACLMDVAAGGAYYLATATDLIVAHPTTVTGGLGVILNLYNLEDMMAQFNLVGTPIKAGDQIDLGTPIRRLPEESRELLQSMADELHGRFRETIIRERRLNESVSSGSEEDPDVLFDGRVMLAAEAQRRGLVDSIGYLDDAIELAASQAGLSRAGPGGGRGSAVERLPTVMLHPQRDPVQSLYGISPNRGIQGDLFPIDVPGLNRERLPTFLFMWQPDPSLR